MISINSFQTNKITIYPNPTSGIIRVSSTENNLKNVSLYSMLGSLIHSEEIVLNEIELNLSHLTSGIYYLVLTSEDRILNQKVIIE